MQLRTLLATHKVLAAKLRELENKLQRHDPAITGILHAVQEMMNPPAPKRRGIGFVIDEN